MKRLISFVLCAVMLVSMISATVITSSAATATWGDGIGGLSTDVLTTDDEQKYGDGGTGYFIDGSKTVYCQIKNGSSEALGSMDFHLFFGVYVTEITSTDRATYGVGTSDGMSAYYDFNRKKFVIQKANSSGWDCDYTNGGILAELPYDLPLNQWFNIGIRMTNSFTGIILNGEYVLAVNQGYASSSACLFWPRGVRAFLDNQQFFVSGYSSALVFGNQYYNAVLWDSNTYAGQFVGRNASGGWFQVYHASHIYTATSGYSTNGFGWHGSNCLPTGMCGMDYTREQISAAKNKGEGVTAELLNNANNAWKALSPTQKTSLAAEGYNHLLAQANTYYYVTNSSDATNAKNLINSIGTVTYTPTSKSKIDAARAAYNTVMAYSYDTGYNNNVTETNFIDSTLVACMSSYTATLEAAETRYAELEATTGANQAAADAVISKINSIGTVTYNSLSAITAAENAYAGLTAEQRALVTNYSTLTSARSTWNALEAEVVAYKNAVAALPTTATATDACKKAIANCATAYATLTSPGQVDAVKTEKAKYDAFRAEWEKVVADTDAATVVINAINQIGKVTYTDTSKNLINVARGAYNNLTDAQKDLVTNYATLVAAESEYARLEASANNEEAVIPVIAAISNLPATITLDDASAVAAARKSYNALTDEQKGLVTNLADLEAAEARIAVLTAAKADADAVVAKIDAIGTVTLDSEAAIVAAEEAYSVLGNDAKNFVTNYSVLTAARSEYNALVKANNTAKVNDFFNRATAEAADATLENEQDILDLLAEAETLRPIATGSSLPKFNQACTKLNKALSTINGLKAIENASNLNRVKATSIVISDSLAINYKITVDSAYEIVGMEFTLGGNTATVIDYTTDANGLLVFRCDNIAPDLMAETITSVVIVKDSEGNDIRCNPAEYSIAAYVNKKIATEGLTELLASMVNYGDAAVAYTNKGYTAPSTVINNWDNYTDSIVAVRNYQSITTIGKELANPSVTWGSAALILSDSVDIVLKLNGKLTDGCYAKTVYGGEEIIFDIVTVSGESYFVWDIYNAAQMSVPVTFTVYDADGNALSNSLRYNIESYVASKITDENLTNLLTAMMQYGDAALAYKNAANG